MKSVKLANGNTEVFFQAMEILTLIKECVDEVLRPNPNTQAAGKTREGLHHRSDTAIYNCVQRRLSTLTGRDCSELPVGLISAKHDLWIGQGYFRQGSIWTYFDGEVGKLVDGATLRTVPEGHQARTVVKLGDICSESSYGLKENDRPPVTRLGDVDWHRGLGLCTVPCISA